MRFARGTPLSRSSLPARVVSDMILVGGASQPAEPFSASTSGRLMRKADVPIMVAKNRLSAEAKTFLVATDFSIGAEQAAEQAIGLAGISGAVLFFCIFLTSPRIWLAMSMS